VWVSVNEADIGKIREKQTARFTVDTYPGQTFEGKVVQIRLNAQMTQNVVTYTVVVAVDNADEKLLPYLTANVQFEVGSRKNVLRVPNAALRWQPEPKWIAPDAREKMPSGPQKPAGRAARPHRVWVQDGQFVRPIAVETGLSDGAMTEIIGGDVTEGMKIILSQGIPMTDVGRAATTASSPLTEQLLRTLFTRSSSYKAMQQTFARMGTNQILVQPGAATSGGVTFASGSASTLTPQDADEIARQCPAVIQAAPVVRARTQVVYGNRNWVPINITGTTPSFLSVRDWEELAEGAEFSDADVRNASKVCLIGNTLKRELFQGESPLGQEIRIQNVAFKVIGVLGRKGANVMGMDQDDIVLAPWTTIKFRVPGSQLANVKQNAAAGTTSVNALHPNDMTLYPAMSDTEAAESPQPIRFVNVDLILTKAASEEQIPVAIGQITNLLRQRHHIQSGQDDDFNLRDMTELKKAMSFR
jgi:hypothetical protein